MLLGIFQNPMEELVKPLVTSLVFTGIGVLLFAICILLVVRVCPFSVRKEIEDDQNISLGIIIGSLILGIAIILAASIHG
ncbi:MAG: DUF350 domain-containing protein [Planctomycetales bacterium]|nr:DUF350 domain-containing protein [Planctomycetales bacterium]